MTSPTTERTLDEILADRLANGDQATLTTEEHDRVYAAMWADPAARPTKRLIGGFPEIWAEVIENATTYDVRQEGSGYWVGGEPAETYGKQAVGLDSGQMWVARYIGEWVDAAYTEDDAWAAAARDCRLKHGGTE